MSTRAIRTTAGESEEFFSVSPLMIFPHTRGKFEVYLKQGGRHVLYTRGQEGFTEAQRSKLFDHGVEEIFVLCGQRKEYEDYVEEHLGGILLNPKMPIAARSRVFYDASARIVKDALGENMPGGLAEKQYGRMNKMVDHTVDFFGLSESLRSVGALISHDYKTYTHSVHVMMYTVGVLESLEEFSEEEISNYALGALLHDIGKTRVPHRILEKPGKLNNEEWASIKRHPALGLAVCVDLPLTPAAMACIMFHHEKFDGTGYPACLQGEDIPRAVKVVTLADVFDALTSDRSYASGMDPLDALRIMREEMAGAFDQELFSHLINVLAKAGIIRQTTPTAKSL